MRRRIERRAHHARPMRTPLNAKNNTLVRGDALAIIGSMQMRQRRRGH